MPQKKTVLGATSSPKVKTRRPRHIVIFLGVSILIQLLSFYGLEKLLERNNGINVEPTAQAHVRQREIRLVPSPHSPGTMAISADHTLLALKDTNKLRIYNLVNGREVRTISLHGNTLGAIQWLPDRNRLIYALMNNKDTKAIREPIQRPVKGSYDESYGTETYRQPVDYRTVTKENFKVTLYSLDDQKGAVPELIRTLHQTGQMPPKVNLTLSTYTNLIYVYWTEHTKNYLVQVDIMKRIKDIRLLGGRLTRLVVSQRTGKMWAELNEDSSAFIYRYQNGHWKLQKFLDGYRLLGVTPDDQLAVAPDQGGQAKKVYLIDENENFKPCWTFNTPISLNRVIIIADGRLMYFGSKRVTIHTPQVRQGTVFNISKVEGYSPDRRMLVSWQRNSNRLKIMEEVNGNI